MKRFLALLLLMLLVRPTYVLAENEFVVSSATTRLNGNVYFLDARFEINLPGYIASAFEKGFDLPISMQVDVIRYRDYWFNEALVTIRQQYLLQYHAILDSVTLMNVNAGSRQHFSSLKDAVEIFLSTIAAAMQSEILHIHRIFSIVDLEHPYLVAFPHLFASSVRPAA